MLQQHVNSGLGKGFCPSMKIIILSERHYALQLTVRDRRCNMCKMLLT